MPYVAGPNRQILVTYQQRNNLILKPKPEEKKVLFLFWFYFFQSILTRHLISTYSLVSLQDSLYAFPDSAGKSPALYQPILLVYLGNDDSLWVITYIFQGFRFHGYSQLKVTDSSPFVYKNEI